MKTVKTSKLTGAALDWAVAKCEGRALREPRRGTDEEAAVLPAPFKMFEVVAVHKPDNTVERRIEPITVTRYGVRGGCRAPSIDFIDSAGREATGSVGLFFFDRAEAELELRECTHGSAKGFTPSQSWMFGGPIIEREGIAVFRDLDDEWQALKSSSVCQYLRDQDGELTAGIIYRESLRYGSTPLIAAMRCYAASKLGDTVEVPEELLS